MTSANEIKQNKRRQTLLENKDKAIISKELVTLKKDAPTEIDLEQLKELAIKTSKPKT